MIFEMGAKVLSMIAVIGGAVLAFSLLPEVTVPAYIFKATLWTTIGATVGALGMKFAAYVTTSKENVVIKRELEIEAHRRNHAAANADRSLIIDNTVVIERLCQLEAKVRQLEAKDVEHTTKISRVEQQQEALIRSQANQSIHINRSIFSFNASTPAANDAHPEQINLAPSTI